MTWLCLLLMIFTTCNSLSQKFEEYRKANNKDTSKKMFKLAAEEAAILDEINTIRQVVASGFCNNILEKIVTIMWDGAKAVFQDLYNQALEVFDIIGSGLIAVGDQIEGWGKALISSEGTLDEVGNSMKDAAVDVGKKASNAINDAGKKVGDFFGIGRRKKRFIRIPGMDYFDKPENTFGPATNMNMMTYNRRLAQLAMTLENAKQNRTVMYEGKLYRVTKYGTIATYVVSKFGGATIVGLFKIVRIGYLACKMWFTKTKVPLANDASAYDTTLEMLFADRSEVGCFFTFPDSFCVVGPIEPGKEYLYESGTKCSSCKHGCVPGKQQDSYLKDLSNSLCNPPPSYFYAMREKYKDHLRKKIEKFEIVEGFDGKPPPIGHNFMLDSVNTFNALTFIFAFQTLFILLK
ncbi:hypothetical protein B9Z55_012015 [Caenorhabditis nigoni]|nr:hypothetical protein B9Z55_012015 [Caenorhabditis nigoni]